MSEHQVHLSDMGDPMSLLRRLMPEAEARAAALSAMPGRGLVAQTGLFEAARAHCRIDTAVGVHIRRRPGGWVADVEFSNVPAGISNILGSPENNPLRTREDALDHAVNLLANLIVAKDEPRPHAVDPVFLYHGIAITVPQALLSTLAACRPDQDDSYAKRRLGDIDEALAPVTAEKLNALDEKTRIQVVTIATMALLSGVMRWPPAGAPDGAARRKGATPP